MEINNYVIFAFIVLFSLTDLWSTKIGISKGAVEKNPILRFLISKLGVIAGILSWKIPSLILIFIYLDIFTTVQLLVLALVMLSFTVWNVITIKRMKPIKI